MPEVIGGLTFMTEGERQEMARFLVSKGANSLEFNTNETLSILVRARDTLCDDCRRGMSFNMNGGHCFDIHARPCKAIEIRALILAVLSKKG